uniref:Uncharacterized protein n=1 Tax=Anguilla anguilla TaxID=7936 RepID=A0A0E9WBZ8_ANGAN
MYIKSMVSSCSLLRDSTFKWKLAVKRSKTVSTEVSCFQRNGKASQRKRLVWRIFDLKPRFQVHPPDQWLSVVTFWPVADIFTDTHLQYCSPSRVLFMG